MWRAWAGVALAGVALAGCGGGDGANPPETTPGATEIPAGAVAVVAGKPITREFLDDNLALALAAGTDGQVLAATYPDAAACAERLGDAADPPTDDQGEAITTPEGREEHCRSSFARAKQQTMEGILRLAIAEQAAAERGVRLTAAQHEDPLGEIAAPSAIRRILRISGLDRARFEELSRLVLLDSALQRELSQEASGPPATRADMERYFREHRGDFRLPERRVIRFVVSQTERDALAARRALERGASWPAVVRRYAADGSSRDLAGATAEVAAGSQEPATDRLIFGARPGELAGPGQVESGWLVVEVVEEHPPRVRTLDEAEADVAAALSAAASRQADKALAEFTSQWREKTTCLPELAVALCANGPEPPPTPDEPSGQITTTP